MPGPVLGALKLVFLAALYLFLARVVRAVWVEIYAERRSASEGIRTGAGGGLEHAPSGMVNHGAPQRDARKSKRRRQPALRVVAPAQRKGASFPIENEMTIGRAPGCAISIDDSFASQIHARIYRSSDGTVFVEDLGSTNGTTLNGKPVRAPVALRRKDRLQIGNTVLELTK